MAHTKLFDKSGPYTTYWHDEPDGSITIESVQDVEHVLESINRQFNDYGDKRTPGKMGELHHVGSVPVVVWDRWMQETNGAIAKDHKLAARYLNDPEFKYFKTSPMKV